MTYNFNEFCRRIKNAGASAVINSPVVLKQDDIYRMTYVPFEHTNTEARLVLVSTTPGYTQCKLACKLTEQLLSQPATETVIQRENKRQAELGGHPVRPNLIRMLEHFGVGRWFGLGNASALWDEGFRHLQPMALLPHPTTKQGMPFAGDFSEVLSVPMLFDSFQSLFMKRLQLVHPDSLYFALGQCAWDGLQHAASHGLVRPNQLVGVLPSPARRGIPITYFLREVSRDELTAAESVRHGVELLDLAYAGIAASIEQVRRQGLHPTQSRAPGDMAA